MGDRLRSTSSIPGNGITAEQSAYSAKLWLPSASQKVNKTDKIDNERTRIQEVVTSSQPSRFQAQVDSDAPLNFKSMTYDPISSVHHQNQPTGIPESVLQTDRISSRHFNQPSQSSTNPAPNTNSGALGSSAAIIGVGSQIIQSVGSTTSKISSSRKMNNASILGAGKASSGDLINDRSFRLQQTHAGPDRNLNNMTMDHRDSRRFTSSQEGQHETQTFNNQSKPDDLILGSPNSASRPIGQGQHIAAMQDLMPHYSEVIIKQNDSHKDQISIGNGRQQRFDGYSVPQRISVTPTKIPSHKNGQDQLYQPSASNANSATHPSKAGSYNLISSPQGTQKLNVSNLNLSTSDYN